VLPPAALLLQLYVNFRTAYTYAPRIIGCSSGWGRVSLQGTQGVPDPMLTSRNRRSDSVNFTSACGHFEMSAAGFNPAASVHPQLEMHPRLRGASLERNRHVTVICFAKIWCAPFVSSFLSSSSPNICANRQSMIYFHNDRATFVDNLRILYSRAPRSNAFYTSNRLLLVLLVSITGYSRMCLHFTNRSW
jgi:hypothetical protein